MNSEVFWWPITIAISISLIKSTLDCRKLEIKQKKLEDDNNSKKTVNEALTREAVARFILLGKLKAILIILNDELANLFSNCEKFNKNRATCECLQQLQKIRTSIANIIKETKI